MGVCAQTSATRPTGVAVSLARLVSFGLALLAALFITVSASFYDTFPSTRLGPALLVVLLLHVLAVPRMLVSREALFYGGFVTYMFVQLAWTEDRTLAFNTLVPAVNFTVIVVLTASLVAFHHARAVLLGLLAGLSIGAAYYSSRSGFPLVYPKGFSYNAMAILYLFGLLLVLMHAACGKRLGPVLLMAPVFMGLVLATTSIKTNLGILIGAVAALVVYQRYYRRIIARNAFLIAALVVASIAFIASNEALVASLEKGVTRIGLGLEILQARDDVAGYGGFAKRSRWAGEGLAGWLQNPLFGYGVESFRSRFGITSHSTPVDLMYNSGLIGLLAFYGMFAALLMRLRSARFYASIPVRAVIFAGLVCFTFISLSGTMHYNTYLAAFIGIGAGLLTKLNAEAGDEAPRAQRPRS